MKIDKRILIFALAIIMSVGVTPAFAAGSGTNTANVTVSPAVSILVTGNAAFGSLAANNIESGAQPININSTSNVPINVDVSALNWNSASGTGNMPLTALKFGSNTPMSSEDQQTLNLAAGDPGQGDAQVVNTYMQVPFGSLADYYNTTVTWTASAA